MELFHEVTVVFLLSMKLPDLQARIQVSLFNILEEGDLQIRGFKLRMPLDIIFVFTANPEDYTNRGSYCNTFKRQDSKPDTNTLSEELLKHRLKLQNRKRYIHEDQKLKSKRKRSCKTFD